MSENVRENSENGVFPEMIQLDRFFGPKTPIKKIPNNRYSRFRDLKNNNTYCQNSCNFFLLIKK